MIEILTPNEVCTKKIQSIPDCVFELFNNAIVKYWNGNEGHAIVKQDEVAINISDALSIAKSEVYNLGYMDIEFAYRESGWIVSYNKENAIYKFSKPSIQLS